MDSSNIAELEEKVGQLSLDIGIRREELNRRSLDPSENAPVAEGEPEEQKLDDGTDGSFTTPELLNPLGIFPELVWLEISDKIEDTQDWISLYSVSSKMRNLLKIYERERRFDQVFPHIRKYLTRKDVINLCGANRNIASAILSWAQKQGLAPRPHGEIIEEEKEVHKREYTYLVRLDSRDKIEAVTNELLEGGSSSMIPFGIIFRRWNFWIWGEVEVQYWARAKRFLQLFGKRIWYCKIDYTIDDGNRDARHFPNDVLQFLELIPNIIRLGLKFINNNFEELPNPISLAPPPIFAHLAKLKILSLVRVTHEMDFLKLHAHQLESLFIIGNLPEQSFRYSNLKTLSRHGNPFKTFPLKLGSFAQAPALSIIDTEICVDNLAEFGDTFLQFNQFGGSLEELDLIVSIKEGENNGSTGHDTTWAVNIHLPKLKKLIINNYRGGLGFLQAIPSLEELKFDHTSYSNEIKRILNSNIWDVLPNLQKINFAVSTELGKRTYTRQDKQYQDYPMAPLQYLND